MPSAVYAKYFFDLRTLAEANELAYPAEILSKVSTYWSVINLKNPLEMNKLSGTRSET